jgi:hypothetical protein
LDILGNDFIHGLGTHVSPDQGQSGKPGQEKPASFSEFRANRRAGICFHTFPQEGSCAPCINRKDSDYTFAIRTKPDPLS